MIESRKSPAEAAFPRIEDYALIGDCRCTALVSRSGAIEWLCLPDFHSPSLFASLLDRRKGGYFGIAGHNTKRTSRRYRDGTNILETLVECEGGTAKVIDFMPVAPGDRGLQPERELLRIVEAVEGTPEIEIEFVPRPGYGQHGPVLEHRGKLGWSLSHDGNLYLLRADVELRAEGDGRLCGTARIPAGERRRLSLSFTQRDTAVIPALGCEADEKLAATEDWWHSWSRQNTYAGPQKDAVMRSVLTLKLLQSCLTGAVIAAPTTSLPETIGGERNWDYRFCWLRDTALTLLSFTDTGFYFEASAFFDWMMHATWMTQPRLEPVYDIYGGTGINESTIDLNGYAGSRPVRIGNAANGQLQTDIYGSVVAAARAFIDRGKKLGPMESHLLARIGDAVCEQWREPDNGIWEFRFGRRHNTWSKVMCWSALRDLLHLDAHKAINVRREKFASEAEKIRAAILENACDPRGGYFVGAFGENFMDATLLLLPRVGFIAPDDPRMQATCTEINKRLRSGVFVRRYDEDADDLAGREGAFLICSFWLIDNLVRSGQLEQAEESFNEVVGCANDVGLLSEEIRPDGRTMLGNFPQAFSHSGLVNAALVLAAAKEKRLQS